MSKKVKMIGSKSVFIKYIVKIILLSVISVVLISSLFSLIFLKLDVSIEYAAYISILIVGISAIIISYFSVSSFSNNGAVLGIFSLFPLCIYSLINTVIYSENWLILAVKIALMIVLGAFFGNFSIKKRKKIRVK